MPPHDNAMARPQPPMRVRPVMMVRVVMGVAKVADVEPLRAGG